MLKTRTLLLCLLAAPAFAQHVTVQATNTQAVVSYTAPDATTPCTITAANLPGLVTDIFDVDATLYPNQDQDLSRPDTQATGSYRQVTLGHRTSAKGSDGAFHSLALQANTPHSVTVNCGAWTEKQYFQTENVPMANTGPDTIPFDAGQWGNYAWPTIDYNDKTKAYIDPLTGVLIKRATGPAELGINTPSLYTLQSYGSFFTTSDGNKFSLPTFTQPPNYYTNSIKFRHLGYSEMVYVSDAKFHLTGSGTASGAADRTVSVCLSTDFGQTCSGTPLDYVLPQNTAAEVTVPSAFDQAPDNGWFHSWGDAPIRDEQFTTADDYNFRVNINGQTISWNYGYQQDQGGDIYFPVNALVPGMKIYIYGSNCPSQLCTIGSILDPKTLTIVETGITVPTNSWATFPNFGFKIVKKTSVGSVSYTSAKSDWRSSEGGNVGNQGTDTFCYASPVTGADGQQWYMCLYWGNDNRIGYYATNRVSGDTRLLNAFTGINGNVHFGNGPLQLLVNNSDSVNNDHVTPVPGEYGSLQYLRCTYNLNDPVYGNFQAFYPSNEVNGNPAIYSASVCVSAGSSSTATIQAINAAHPEIDTNYFNSINTFPIAGQGVTYTAVRLFGPNYGTDNRQFWFCLLDPNQTGAASVVQCENNFINYPLRWSNSHGDIYNSGISHVIAVNTQEPIGTNGNYYQVTITEAITATSGTSCSAFGITDPKLISQGATGNNCIEVHAGAEPLYPTYTGDLVDLSLTQGVSDPRQGYRPVAWSHNSAVCNGDDSTTACQLYLQDLAPGDILFGNENGFSSERFLVVKITKAVDGSLDLILSRNTNPWAPMTIYKQAHVANHSYEVWPPLSIGTGGTYYYDVTNTAAGFVPDNPRLFVGHSFMFLNPKGQLASVSVEDCSTFSSYDDMGGACGGYASRNGYYPSIIGQFADHAVPEHPAFAGDASGLGNATSTGGEQSHPGGLTYSAPTHCENPNIACDESFWALDAHPLGATGGGAISSFKQYDYAVPGFSSVKRLSIPLWFSSPEEEYGSFANVAYNNGTNPSAINPPHIAYHWAADLHRKTRTIYGWAGEFLLQDISGPNSQMSDSQPWTYCIADFAGECVNGSSQYDIYVNVPNAGPLDNNCRADFNKLIPCVITLGPQVQQYVQFAYDKEDIYGDRERLLGYGLGAFTTTKDYMSLHATPSADWWPFQFLANGYRQDIFLMKNPGWPKPDSERRHTFLNVPVQVNGVTGDTGRVRFGYNSQLYCGPRQEVCTTATPTTNLNVPHPYAWLSEPQTWSTLANGTPTTLNIPAIAGRVLYYQTEIHHADSTVTLGPVQVTAVQ